MSENPIFSYTHRDYEGSRQEGLSRIPILSRGRWTDLNASDPGIIILDYAHAIADMLSYYQDHQAMEAFLSTAKERVNIFRLAKQLSYKIMSAQGARVAVKFTSPFMKYDHAIRIPKYTAVSTATGISYLTVDDAYLESGATSVSIDCCQGTLFELEYQGTGISKYSAVEGAQDQTITLRKPNIDLDSIVVIEGKGTDNEVVWSPVDYIVFSGSSDRVYQVDLNYDDTVTIKFGDGQRGFLPRDVDKLTVRYIANNAEEGRVNARDITTLMTPILDNGLYIEFLVSNDRPSVGGVSIQSSSDIRELAPGAIKAQDRAVTLDDYERLARLVPGVAGAKAYDININPDLCMYHEVKVLIVPEDNSSDIDLLLANVKNYLSKRVIPPTNLQVFTPGRTPINLDIRIQKLDNAVESRLSYMIDLKVREYFNSIVRSVGEDFYSDDLYSELRSIEGVRRVVSISPSSAYVDDLSVATLGSINISYQ